MTATYNRRIYKAAGNSCAIWCRCCVAAFFFLQALFLSSLVEASIVIAPTGTTASSEFPGREANQSIDSSGLVAGLYGIVPDDMWMSSNADAIAGTTTITWDLGTNYELSRISVLLEMAAQNRS